MNFKCGVIKKNQILASMVVLMLVVAGYLNYTYDPTKDYQVELTGVMSNHLGDTYLVDSSSISTNIDDVTEMIEASGKVSTAEEYFASTRIERENFWDEQKETYQKMLENSAIDEAQKEFAQQEISKIAIQKNATTIAENLIKLKGYRDAVILLNEENANVIVLAESLTEEAKDDIINIVVTELKMNPNKITIRNI